MKIISRALI